ncbi:MAG: 50S ribosome-binding GTPase [Candidatus Eremiobacteraeota bacterium]|nr:50S ribosome-binding GTPase [Candidatus Eremiobacteraeota bacterium]MBC5828118.1 50S ribosome-binding GTPase [Candidatus Eremiobacteraeota bacterium]
MRALEGIADLIDIFIEVRDARIPAATDVAASRAKLRSKPVFIVLNRADLADAKATAAWLAHLRAVGKSAFAGVGKEPSSLNRLRSALLSQGRRGKRLRLAVVGAPNAGKSSVINALARQKRAVVRDQPGVTRKLEWRQLGLDADILDTPGVLSPRIDSADAAWQLALCGILPEKAFDPEEVAERFCRWSGCLASALDVDAFAARRGRLRRGGELDRAAAARSLIAAFRTGALGRMTFERPQSAPA